MAGGRGDVQALVCFRCGVISDKQAANHLCACVAVDYADAVGRAPQLQEAIVELSVAVAAQRHEVGLSVDSGVPAPAHMFGEDVMAVQIPGGATDFANFGCH